MEYQTVAGPEAQELVQLLEGKIDEYNSERLNKHDGVIFSCIVRDDEDKIVAGVGGWTWAGISEVTQLWVNERVRGKGVGKKLLEAAETHAKNKGCGAILVRSYSFQAPEFYKKNGYKVEVVMNDFPKGYDYYFLTKKL